MRTRRREFTNDERSEASEEEATRGAQASSSTNPWPSGQGPSWFFLFVLRLLRCCVHRCAFLLALVAAILPGCAEPPRGVVVWHPYRGGEEQALKTIAARFEAERGTKVTLLAVPYEAYLSKLEAAI